MQQARREAPERQKTHRYIGYPRVAGNDHVRLKRSLPGDPRLVVFLSRDDATPPTTRPMGTAYAGGP